MSPLDFDLNDDSAVRLESVSLRYDSPEDVLSDINLVLKQGSFTFLTGASGAGKTSLLKLLYLARRPSRGRISLFGQRTGNLDRDSMASLRRRVGVVFQDFKLLNHLSAVENVALPLRVMGRKPSDYQDDVTDLMRWVGLGERMNARPATLSGGEQQRVAIARALVGRPSLLLADEPTGNLDPDLGERLMRLFQELNRRLGTTVLIASHDLDLVRRFDAPLIRLQHGILSQDMRPKEGAQ